MSNPFAYDAIKTPIHDVKPWEKPLAEVKDDVVKSHIMPCKIPTALGLGRHELLELGRRKSYHRYVSFQTQEAAYLDSVNHPFAYGTKHTPIREAKPWEKRAIVQPGELHAAWERGIDLRHIIEGADRAAHNTHTLPEVPLVSILDTEMVRLSALDRAERGTR